MKYVILRDDDTNAFTPIDCLERLYRPFLERGLPVNLAVIPNVATDASYAPGRRELFLMGRTDENGAHRSISDNPRLVEYLLSNSGYHIAQHGCRHELVGGTYEFAQRNRGVIHQRLREGFDHLSRAGFAKPSAFVAPNDQFSREALTEVAQEFSVISTGWYELRKLPITWWPGYARKKMLRHPHWNVGQTRLLTHPGCHLSYHKSYDTMLEEIRRSIESRKLTVLVTHWWEYFRDGQPDEPFIGLLHETAAHLAARQDLKVISFKELADQNISLN